MKTQTTEAHSPLPWHTGDASGLPGTVFCGPYDLIGFSTGRSDDPQDNANAALIVEAVNNHARLLAENAKLREALRHLIAGADELATNPIITCEKCEGSGEQFGAHQEACHTCGGVGRVCQDLPEVQDVEDLVLVINQARVVLAQNGEAAPPVQALIFAARAACSNLLCTCHGPFQEQIHMDGCPYPVLRDALKPFTTNH
jgi:hypothetical protein